jgi:hypothetical protein
MTKKQFLGILVFLLLLAGGTVAHWATFQNSSLQTTLISYLMFLATIVGFSITVYQLRETERSIEESLEKPQLEIELVSASKVGLYSSEADNNVYFYPIVDKPNYLGAHVGLRIINKGNKAASKIYLTFVFLLKGAKEDDTSSKLNVIFDQANLGDSQIIYSDSDVRNGYQIGWTFKFSDNLFIHADLYDRPFVAGLDLIMQENELQNEYEIHYRIQSYEGNKSLELLKKKHGARQSQIYAVKFHNKFKRPTKRAPDAGESAAF